MPTYDLAIVGAGPAGSCAGRVGAKAGLSVLLVDKEGFPRDKVCGGGLRPDILEDPHLSFLAERRSEFIICSHMRTVLRGTGEERVEYEAPPGRPIIYGTSRRRFDEVVHSSAVDAGAEALTARVRGIKVEGDKVRVCVAGGSEISARVVIGAGGMQDPVAKYLRGKEGLPPSWPPEDTGVAVASEVEVDEGFIGDAYGSGMTTHLFLKPEGVYGYAWAFPRRTLINIGIGGFFRDVRRKGLGDMFRGHIKRLKGAGLLPRTVDVGTARGARIPLRGPIGRTCSDRLMLAGDAGGFVSPLSGDGIVLALTTGRMAAETAVRCIGKDDCGREALSAYEGAWKRLWGSDFKALCQIADQVRLELDRLIRFAARDRGLVETMVGVYNGSVRPSNALRGLRMKYLKNLVLGGGRTGKGGKGKRG